MSDVNNSFQQLAELNKRESNIKEFVDFIIENRHRLTRDDLVRLNELQSEAHELGLQLDRLKSLNKWTDHELSEGLHPIEDNTSTRSELLKSNDTQKIPK